jgi:predicted amidohydrolase YtcJ
MMDTTVLAAFLEYSPNPTWLVDSDGRCIYANQELKEITGVGAAQLGNLYPKKTDKCLPLYSRKRGFIINPIALVSFSMPRTLHKEVR